MDKKLLSLTPTQVGALCHMLAEGTIRHYPGGFWTTEAAAARGCARVGSEAPSNFWVATQTVRALERRGFIERTGERDDDWRDPRRLTNEGRAVGRWTDQFGGSHSVERIVENAERFGLGDAARKAFSE